ncbi:tRNA (32-2'-O)-methyltransferase regulator THADA-like isoform X2 [Clavelina lepadiformis]|uniref:tRNA (32-2'-O)-methyltransferase regulator THADA-like isoform X2 n=1 Tax=Clavelina lepadiformis TaxID=159417 RepID=UPI0040428DF7
MKKILQVSQFTEPVAKVLCQRIDLLRGPDNFHIVDKFLDTLITLVEGTLENIGDEVKMLKKITAEFKLLDATTCSEIIISISCFSFLLCSPKHPCKELWANLLQIDTFTASLVAVHLQEGLHWMTSNLSYLYISSCDVIKTVELCQTNFSLQGPCITAAVTKVFENVLNNVKMHREMLQELLNVSAEMLEKITSSVVESMQCIVIIFRKKFIQSFCINYEHEIVNARLKETIVGLYDESLLILQQDSLEGDCWYITSLVLPCLLHALKGSAEYYKEVMMQLEEFSEPSTNKNLWKIILSDGALLSLCGGLLVNESNRIEMVVDTDCLDENLSNTEDKSTSHSSSVQTSLHREILALIFTALFTIHKRITSVAGQVALAKSLAQWSRTARLLANFNKEDYRKETHQATECLAAYVALNLDNPVDVIRHQVKDIYVEILKAENISSGNNGFAIDQAFKILNWDWHKRSLYVALQCLLDFVPVHYLYENEPQLHVKLLKACFSQSLAPYASHLYHQLALRQSETIDITEQLHIWLKPALIALLECDVSQARILLDYCFSKLLKLYGQAAVPFALHYLHNSQENVSNVKISSVSSSANKLRVLIMFLRAAQQFGLQINAELNKTNPDQKSIDKETVKFALVHQNDQIRLDTFFLICDSWKPSVLITESDLLLLKFAFPYNMTNQCPAHRQQFLNTIKKFLHRLLINLQYIQKPTRKKNEQNQITDFLKWLVQFCLKQLFIGNSYPRRSLSLSILYFMLSIFKTKEGSPVPVELFTLEYIKVLVNLLQDTFEDNRLLALNILTLSDLKGHVKAMLGSEFFENLQTSSYNQCRRSYKSDASRNAAYNLRFNARLSDNVDLSIIKTCRHLMSFLVKDVQSANENLVMSAYTTPMHGVLYCLRLLLPEADVRNTQYRQEWRKLEEEIVSCCFQVYSAVFPVVGNDSPEGFIPKIEEAELRKICDEIGMLCTDLEDERSVAQKVLVASWRSAKESSLLLQLIASHALVDSSVDDEDCVLSWKQLLQIGDHLRMQIMETRHRGAFEVAYAALKDFCPILWRSNNAKLNTIPKRWVEEAMNTICNPANTDSLCATRRSAGLPFFLQAVLGSDKGKRSRDCLHSVMSRLLSIVDCEIIKSITMETDLKIQVHSLNILRGLVKDASLGEDMLPYISRCLMVSLTGFDCQVWSVRNSSTLLFSSLVTRMFGVKREKDLETSGKNRLSSHEFFTRMPDLHEFILQHLHRNVKSIFKDVNIEKQSSLFPVLLLLSRIYPSLTRHDPSSDLLNAFVPLVIKCACSSIFKCRVMAATALSSIVSKDCSSSVLLQLANALIVSSSHNETHGILLLLTKLLRVKFRNNINESSDMTDAVVYLTHTLNQCDDRRRGVYCVVNRSAFIDLCLEVTGLCKNFMKDHPGTANVDFATKSLITKLIKEVNLKQKSSTILPGCAFLYHSQGKLLAAAYGWGLSSDLTSISANNLDLIFAALKVLKQEYKPLISTVHLKLEGVGNKIPEDIQNFLVQLSKSVSNHECLAQIYKLLTLVSASRTSQVLALSRLLAEDHLLTNQKLFGAVVLCQAVSLRRLIDCDVDAPMLKWLRRWLELLTQASSLVRNDVCVRVSVAKALRTVTGLLLKDGKSHLVEVCHEAWKLLLILLYDENADVREIACDIVHVVARAKGQDMTGHQLVDCLAMEIALDVYVTMYSDCDAQRCQATLDQVISFSHSDLKTAEANNLSNSTQLFESGSWNTYVENPLLKQVIAKARRSIMSA